MKALIPNFRLESISREHYTEREICVIQSPWLSLGVLVFCLVTAVLAVAGSDSAHAAVVDEKPTRYDYSETTIPRKPGQVSGALLDAYPGAYAAYSLRRLRSDYEGPAVRILRTSDGAERDFGFTSGGESGGELQVAALEDWLAGSDGRVIRWYSQLTGHPALVPDDGTSAPYVARGGSVVTSDNGRPRIDFTEGNSVLEPAKELPASIPTDDMSAMLVVETTGGDTGGGGIHLLGVEPDGNLSYERPQLVARADDRQYKVRMLDEIRDAKKIPAPWSWQVLSVSVSATEFRAYSNHEQVQAASASKLVDPYDALHFQLGGTPDGAKWKGYVGELVMYSALTTKSQMQGRYDNINAYWKIGPTEYHTDALLPQAKSWQVGLYNWLETIERRDVEIAPTPLQWDGTYTSSQQLANIWNSITTSGLAAATRGDSRWFVLDDGNGGGIEGSGEIKFYYKDPGGHHNEGGAGANAAFWYQLDVPTASGGNGNYYYQNRSVALRAIITSAVEMMLFEKSVRQNRRSGKNDMYGKVLASAAYVYMHTKHELPVAVRSHYESAMRFFVEETIEKGAFDVNTNMDMFAVRAFAIISQSVDDEVLRTQAVEAAKRLLLGYSDGKINTKHDSHSGTFFPAGYIGENDGPETTYNGQSIAQLVRAYSYVMNDSDWQFLREVIRRMVEFKQYQHFPDPDGFYTGPSGYSGRTGGSYVRDQGGGSAMYAYDIPETHVFSRRYKFGGVSMHGLRSEQWLSKNVLRAIERKNRLGYADIVTDVPPQFNAWGSWPPEHPSRLTSEWRGRLLPLIQSNDPSTWVPYKRDDFYFSKAFGGPPTGNEFWAYKNTDGKQAWGFFIEADAQQGNYHGWFGGKLETFWTEEAGVVILNVRHDKDKFSWNEIDYWAVQHVWGIDDSPTPKRFSTAELRGRREVDDLQRTSVVKPEASVPYAEVKNVFNDSGISATANRSGEETGSELEGSVTVTNRFEAVHDGVGVTHVLSSDQSDQATERWTTLPVNLRYADGPGTQDQANIPDATIAYWTGESWKVLPEDEDGDGVPELTSTSAIRIGRDYFDGRGPQYAYVNFETEQSVRMSTQVWEQSYQGHHRIRNIHIDLHGNPGVAAPLPAEKSVSYTVQTTNPVTETNPSSPTMVTEESQLEEGWNIVSLSVEPSSSGMEEIFSDLSSVVQLVKNEAGQTFDPATGVNEIGTWEADEAYRVYANTSATLGVSGTVVDPPETSISLEKGWNLVPYLPDQSLPVGDAVSSISSSVVIVKDDNGQVYYPSFGIDQIGQLEPGNGYMMYVSEGTTLTYPEGSPAGKTVSR